MIRKVVDTYDEKYFHMYESAYRSILAAMQQLDFATKEYLLREYSDNIRLSEYLDNFLSNFAIKTVSGDTYHHISIINPSRSRFPNPWKK
jgi:hypothetical protein